MVGQWKALRYDMRGEPSMSGLLWLISGLYRV